MLSEEALPSPWGAHALDESDEREIAVGPLRLRVRRIHGEVWIAHSSGHPVGEAPTIPEARSAHDRRDPSERRPDEEEEEEEVAWTRWAVPEGTGMLRLVPVFPDRSVVVEPERPFHVVRGARLRIYVRVPLHVRIDVVGSTEETLTRVPTVTLSDTWFGDFQDGALCYFLPTTARREIGHEHFAPHLAACPLQLSNAADEQLPVEKLALRVAHLSLFARGDELWADETVVRYRGTDTGSDIQMSGKAPGDAPDARPVAEPEMPVATGLRARTFARLASLPGFGSAS